MDKIWLLAILVLICCKGGRQTNVPDSSSVKIRQTGELEFKCMAKSSVLGIRWHLDNKNIGLVTKLNCSVSPEFDQRFVYSCTDEGFSLVLQEGSIRKDINGSTLMCADLQGGESNKIIFYLPGDISIDQDTTAKQFNETVEIKTENRATVFQENTTVRITCTFDDVMISHVNWTLPKDNIDLQSNFIHLPGNSTMKMSSKVNTSDPERVISQLSIRSTRCEDTGMYTCIGWKDNAGRLTKSLNISFYCSPKILKHTPKTKTTEVKNGGSVEFSVLVLAYPKPRITWTFISEQDMNTKLSNNMTVFGSFAYIETLNSVAYHISTLNITNISNENFGTYSAVAQNEIGFHNHEFILQQTKDKEIGDDLALKVVAPVTALIVMFLLCLGILFLAKKLVKSKQQDKTSKPSDRKAGSSNMDTGGFVANDLYASADFPGTSDDERFSNTICDQTSQRSSVATSYESVCIDVTIDRRKPLASVKGENTSGEDVPDYTNECMEREQDTQSLNENTTNNYDRRPIPVPRRTIRLVN